MRHKTGCIFNRLTLFQVGDIVGRNVAFRSRVGVVTCLAFHPSLSVNCWASGKQGIRRHYEPSCHWSMLTCVT